jgi:hypothetical protein
LREKKSFHGEFHADMVGMDFFVLRKTDFTKIDKHIAIKTKDVKLWLS